MADLPADRDQRAWQEALDWIFALDRSPGDQGVMAGLQDWLGRQPENARAWAEARSIWDIAPRLAEVAPVLVAPVLAVPAEPVRPGLRPSRRRWLVGGGLALAAGLAGVSLAPLARRLGADFATGVGERRDIALPDGSRVLLNTDSTLSVDFTAGRRLVTLSRGEAFFTVARDPARPFVVAAATARAEALGTAFGVRLDTAAVDVAVATGLVGLGNAQLKAGESGRFDLATGVVTKGGGVDLSLAWRQGQLVVDRWPVTRVLDELGRYHQGRILLRDGDLGRRPVSGVYDLNRPAEAVRAVVAAAGGRVTELTPWLLVVSPT